jgi:hypothetical protein
VLPAGLYRPREWAEQIPYLASALRWGCFVPRWGCRGLVRWVEPVRTDQREKAPRRNPTVGRISYRLIVGRYGWTPSGFVLSVGAMARFAWVSATNTSTARPASSSRPRPIRLTQHRPTQTTSRPNLLIRLDHRSRSRRIPDPLKLPHQAAG